MTDNDHDKNIATPEFNNSAAENFAARLAQANLARKNDIAALVKNTDFDDKRKNLNENVTLNETKHVLVENELNKVSEKIKVISTKGLTKDLIHKFSIVNGAKYFSLGISQNYLVFIPAKNTLNIFVALLRLIRRNLVEYEKKILKI